MKRFFIIAIFLTSFVLFSHAPELFARSTSDDGGFMIEYPAYSAPSHQAETAYQHTKPLVNVAPIRESLAPDIYSDSAPIEATAIQERDELIAKLQKQVSVKTKQIALLEERVDRLSKSLVQKDAELFTMRPEVVQKYKVQKGDSLWKIAARKDTYGNPYMWITIYNANMSKIQDPNFIFAGQLFDIPK